VSGLAAEARPSSLSS